MLPQLLGVMGSFIAGFFGFKREQAKTIVDSLEAINKMGIAESEKDKARAAVLVAEATSESWLTRTWRPLVMMIFAGLVVARWVGYMPSNMSEAELLEVYGLLKLGIGGYIGSRGIEKIVSNLQLGSILKKYIEKKVG